MVAIDGGQLGVVLVERHVHAVLLVVNGNSKLRKVQLLEAELGDRAGERALDRDRRGAATRGVSHGRLRAGAADGHGYRHGNRDRNSGECCETYLHCPLLLLMKWGLTDRAQRPIGVCIG